MHHKLLLTTIFLMIFGVTCTASAGVVINEIAWMGTEASANDEWIELANTDSSPVDLTGWKISATDGAPNIMLSGTIAANGYFLMERTDDGTVPSVAASMIYTGALDNDGEVLQLKNASDTIIDSIDQGSGWTAGDASSKHTAQRSGTAWITVTGTPGVVNAAAVIIPPATPEPPNAAEWRRSEPEIKINYTPNFSVEIKTPNIIVQEVPFDFDAEVREQRGPITYYNIDGKFRWNFGDGGWNMFQKKDPINYIYHDPGEYVVSLNYYSSLLKHEPDALHQKTITVIPARVDVSIGVIGAIVLTNESTDDLDLHGWKLLLNDKQFVFPEYTILKKDGTISIPASIHRLPAGKPVLLTPTGYPASRSAAPRVLGASITKTPGPVITEAAESEDLYTESQKTIIPTAKTPWTNSAIFWFVAFIFLSAAAAIGFHFLHPADPKTSP